MNSFGPYIYIIVHICVIDHIVTSLIKGLIKELGRKLAIPSMRGHIYQNNASAVWMGLDSYHMN